MPEEIQRSVTGIRGAFPLRFPVGKSLAFVTVLALVPVWWEVGEAVRPRIMTFYAKTYWKSLADGWATAPNGLPTRAPSANPSSANSTSSTPT